MAMGMVERVGYGGSDPHCFINRKLLLSVDAVPEGLALQIRHDVEKEAVRFTGVMERQDVRVSQIRRGRDLGQEPLGPNYRCEFGLQDFEGDVAVVLEVLSQIHRRHAALTQLTVNLVAAFEGRVETSDGIGHGAQDASKTCGAASNLSPPLSGMCEL